MVAGSVSVIIPHIPVRSPVAALASVFAQTYTAKSVLVETDFDKTGSAATRNRALQKVDTEWVAFLDDDDYFLPHHLRTLIDHAGVTGADVVYAGCIVVDKYGKEIPRQDEWGRFGEEFDPDLLRQGSYLPVTSLVRSDLAKKALFGPPVGVDTPYDDWGFYLRLLDLGATFSHIPEVTWIWNHNGLNTSGQPHRW